MNEPAYANTVKTLVDNAEALVKQNNTIDMYEMYFEGIEPVAITEPPSCKTLCVMRDPASDAAVPGGGAIGGSNATGTSMGAGYSSSSVSAAGDVDRIHRAVAGLSWHPEDTHKLAVAYSVLKFQVRFWFFNRCLVLYELFSPSVFFPFVLLTLHSLLYCVFIIIYLGHAKQDVPFELHLGYYTT